ncbi:hypothetical protein PR048_001496 [Dryococelus australis]|uniref:DUF4371 domain-containing protein n=1 Tax=Dryococelus australis TaxID=614101 RepID=A0ABQ9IJY8_9NEOP|nr:hypothetical protein PR048_001496 [Dryococelus australis]
MVIMIRFFRANEVETHLYRVVAFDGKATGDNLLNVVNKSFEDDGISWQNCLIMSSDDAKVMVGEINYVLSRVKGQQENLWFLHCTCHVAHLHAVKYQMYGNNYPEMFTHTTSKHLGKRQDGFHNIQKSLGVEEHKILRPCFTRWLAMLLQCAVCSHVFSEACVLLRQFIASFVWFPIIQKASIITSVDFKRENQLSDAALFGLQCEHFSKFYEMGTRELYHLLPLQDEVLKRIDILEQTKKKSGDWEKV